MTKNQEAMTAMNKAAEAMLALAADMEGGKLAELEAQVEALKQSTDTAIAAKAQEIDDFLQTLDQKFDSRIPMPPNLIKNALMTDLDGTRPLGYSAIGLNIEAVNPLTQAFEGIYSSGKPANAVDDPLLATPGNPYWFGRYGIGPRMVKGGIRNGWAALGRGGIMKITAQARTGDTIAHRMLKFTHKGAVKSYTIGFRAWIKLVKGSRFGLGNHAGYRGSTAQGYSRAEIDAGPQGWLPIDIVHTATATDQTLTHGASSNAFTIGFSHDEEIEAYLAMPYMWLPRSMPMGFVE